MRIFGYAIAAVGLIGLSGCSGVKTAPAQTTGSVTVTEVVPASGPLAGNIPLEIRGTGFVAGNLLVTFGGTAVADATVVNATTVHGTLPSRSSAGAVDVVVACAAGQATLPNGFTYHDAAAMSITGVNPTNGPVAGGTTVTITGTGFQGGSTTVAFGSNNGTGVTVASDTQLSVVTPASAAAGPVSITVINNNGSASLPNSFVYGAVNTAGGTVTEHLGGVSEFDSRKDSNSAPTTEGHAFFFSAMDTVWPAPGSCALDLDQFPGLSTTLDAGANVQVSMGTRTSTIPKDTSTSYVSYSLVNGSAANFSIGSMAGIKAPGAAVAAFDRPTVVQAPGADYSAWLDPLGFSNFTGGGFWSGSSDLWVTWGEGSQGTVNNPVNHVQIILVGMNLGTGAQHYLQCDVRDPSVDAQGGFCVRGGGSGDICQTPGATMKDFYTAIGGSFNSATVALFRGNRSTYDIGGGTNAALDVNIMKTTSLIMSN